MTVTVEKSPDVRSQTQIRSVLIVRGAFGDMYEPAWHRALSELGIKSGIFDCHELTLPGIVGRIERRILAGPGITRIRKNLIRKVEQEKPDVTLLYQGHYCNAATLAKLRKLTFVAGYHNDDPFGGHCNMLRYRHFSRALPLYHCFHVYRRCNVQDMQTAGISRVKVLMSYYLPWIDYPRVLSDKQMQRWGCDVIFAGHCEKDLRLESVTGLARENLRVWTYGNKRNWEKSLPAELHKIISINPAVFGEDYRNALCGAKIALSFFSRWNRDQYTRRVFEIPACGVFLLCERTPVMQELFTEGKEAEFFSTADECIDKAKFYLRNESARKQIAAAGFDKVRQSGHDIYSRMKQWLTDVSIWRNDTQLNDS